MTPNDLTQSSPASGLAAIVSSAWISHARCGQADGEAFFPDDVIDAEEARRLCGSCLVQAECLDWALATGERFGIWGGLDEDERRRLNQLMNQEAASAGPSTPHEGEAA